MGENGLIDVTREESIAVVKLDQPKSRNALSLALLKELKETMQDIGKDKSVTVVVLGANGSVFSSGHNLKELVGDTLEAYREIFYTCTQAMEQIQAIPQPVIGMVQGMATAAGCQLAATCDLVVAAETATFATPGVKIGLFCTTPMIALSRAVGRKKALEMLLTGEPLSAKDALIHGLVNKVVARRILGSGNDRVGQKNRRSAIRSGFRRETGVLRSDRADSENGLPVRAGSHADRRVRGCG